MDTPLSDEYGIDEQSRAERKNFLDLTPEDEAAVADLRKWFDHIAPQLIESFYEHLLKHEPSARFLHDPGLVDRLQSMQTQYFAELVSGRYDAEYVEQRLRVGQAHHQIGLAPRWYLGAYNVYMQQCFPAFARALGGDVPPALLSLLKVILLDIGLTLETYFAASTQQLQRQNQELEKALQIYFSTEIKARQYAKLTGHEIRGSLNAIANVVEEVAEDFADEIPSEAREMLIAANDRCRQMMHVVERILAEPEHAGQPKWVETSDLLREVEDRMPIYSSNRSVELRLPQESVRVWADPIGLREVFANLISNAVHHIDGPDAQITVAYERECGVHVFSVRDNGPGIPRNAQQHIFQPFYRATTRPRDGKGLGLYFVRRIVEQHGGLVWIDSAVGDGCRVSFSLPVEPGGRDDPDKPTN